MLSQKKYRTGVEKSDILRYLLLFHYGGVYADLDVECLRPFEPLLQRHSGEDRFGCVFGAEPHGHAQKQARPTLLAAISFGFAEVTEFYYDGGAGEPKSINM